MGKESDIILENQDGEIILESDMIFQNVEHYTDKFTLENQDGKRILESDDKKYDMYDIEEYVGIMLDDTDQFVTLCAPEAIENIRYVQAVLLDDGTVPVQIGIETKKGTILYEKMCDAKECLRIFKDFFLEKFKPDIKEYKPVEF